ncbi:2-oxo acid dehydrogenase subunit E2 [Planosporangium flavigriseum]|uniref:Dihydrolipoamide acetyltransferase component of pyruvate dehydrogenase complex n=1 Tax=Planosporangium flavigriseum TaxID=373681 RepID=A0A8J3LU76_9ACTN|nr:dihydrolipoamide acetyltransferase family protein [Planosporangium flavigriseum]NJC64385.1 2-oxo acid dehydrogenase subunit E2 [Planosporangium flavigriseum]GIG73914.1 dihydrolipoamide acetyltransferase component of pyruvate dehydrogenase complex [Planosporangium flavigriseum]
MTRIKEFPLPDLGEGLAEGEILKWLVGVGDTIELNQPIVEVETAKAAVEIPAKWAGQVSAIFHAEGETVEVGTPIIAIDTDPGAGPADQLAPSAESLAAVTVAPAEGMVEPGMTGGGRTPVLVGYGPRNGAAKRRARVTEPAAPAPPQQEKPAATVDRPLAKPPVRKLAKDLGVDLFTLTGTGPNGSITRDDVQQAVQRPAVPAAPSFGPGREQRIPVKGVRKLTAANMVASAFTAPHVTEFLTVDVTRSMRALDRLRELPDWRGVRVSPLLLVAKAVLVAIKRYPMVNSSWAGDDIVVKEYVNLGIAAATERGLIVPNIKDVGRLTLRELADAMSALVTTAKEGRTSPADMTGGTFTITNVGVFGVDTGTPILPPGEAAILAFGAVREMPWVHKGKIKPRPVTTLGLSFDHRIIDGELGSKFLRDIGVFLSDPEAALLAWG